MLLEMGLPSFDNLQLFVESIGHDYYQSCRLLSVISDGWAIWAVAPPWSLSCSPWSTGWTTSTCSCCPCYACWSCRGLMLRLTIVSMNDIIWWAIVSVTNQSHCWNESSWWEMIELELVLLLLVAWYIHGLAPCSGLLQSAWWRKYRMGAAQWSC